MFDITKPTKYTLSLQTPVMAASGTMGYGSTYEKLLHLDKLGAIVTNPISYHEWSPARGTRVVPLDAGVLIHSGHPNPGVKKVIEQQQQAWAKLPVPLVVHLIATTAEEVRRAVEHLDHTDSVAAIELGLDDDIAWRDAEDMVLAATKTADKPILVRLPLLTALDLGDVCADAGAGALVVAAPPRGTARDPRSGRLISGRIYGPTTKPLALRSVGLLAKHLQSVPIIGAGGIHSIQDARDYLDAGAVAVQVDSVVWIQPRIIERIARDLMGNLVTKATDAFPDEWNLDFSESAKQASLKKPNTDDPDAAAHKQR